MRAVKNLLCSNPVRDVLGIFAISRFLILVIGYLSSLVILKGEFFNTLAVPAPVLDLFYRWDSWWYMSIVNNGYSYNPGVQSNVIFFPLFPLIIKMFDVVFRNPMISGFIVSNIFFILGSVYLYRLIAIDHKDTAIASKAVFYMMIFPVTFFFSVPYTESLFLFLATGCFYHAIKRQWFIASVFGFLISLTRIVGVLILIPLLVEYINGGDNRRIKKDIFWLLSVPCGLLSYMWYTFLKFGDALAFYNAGIAWNRKFSSIFITLINANMYPLFYRFIFFGTVIFMLFLIAHSIYSKIRPSYVVYSVFFFIAYLSANMLESIMRYIMVLFPLYISLSVMAHKNKMLDIFITLFFSVLLSLFTILFVNGYWFV